MKCFGTTIKHPHEFQTPASEKNIKKRIFCGEIKTHTYGVEHQGQVVFPASTRAYMVICGISKRRPCVLVRFEFSQMAPRPFLMRDSPERDHSKYRHIPELILDSHRLMLNESLRVLPIFVSQRTIPAQVKRLSYSQRVLDRSLIVNFHKLYGINLKKMSNEDCFFLKLNIGAT